MQKKMKKISIAIIFLFSVIISGQKTNEIDILDTTKFMVYVQDTVFSGPHNFANAAQVILNRIRANPTDKVQGHPLGVLRVNVGSKFFQVTETIPTKINTYFKDTVMTIRPIKQNCCNELFAIVGNQVLKIKMDRKLKKLNENFNINIRTHLVDINDQVYVDSVKMLPVQPINFVTDTIRSQDSSQTTTKTFYTKHWLYSKRGGMRLDSLSDWTPWVGNPGYAIIDNDTVRRHTQQHSDLYFQSRALDTTFNIIDEGKIQVNPFIKTTLRLSDLRVDKLTSGMNRIRVTGNEPCRMYFKFKEVGTNQWLQSAIEWSYNYNSHGINEPRLENGKIYDISAFGVDIKGMLVVISKRITIN